MRRARLWTAMLLVLALGMGAAPMAQQATAGTGTIEGLVTDPQQVPLPGATVVVKRSSTGVENAVITGADGKYKIEGLPAATDYVLIVSFAGGGYSTITQDRIAILAERITVESIQLFEQQTEQVIVSAKKSDRRVVDLEEVGSKTQFDAEFLEGLPLLGRNYQDILTLAAGVVDPNDDGNPNVLGARAENFKTVIDGVSNQDPLGGGFLSNLNSDAIAEVEVITSGADASFSRASGGFANIVTKSGSNDFEGTFNLSLRSSILDGNGQTGQVEGDFQSIRPSVTASGALLKDKLWYFITDEEFNDDIPINTLSGRNTLIREVNGRRFLAKLTYQMSSNNKMEFQVRADPLEFTNLGVNSVTLQEAGFTQEQGGPFAQIKLDTVFSPTVLLQSLIGFSDTSLDITPNTPQDPNDNRPFTSAALVIDQDNGAISGSWFLQQETQIQRLSLRQDLNVFVDDFFGRHDLSAGLEYANESFDSNQLNGMIRQIQLLNPSFGAETDPTGGGREFFVSELVGVPEAQGGRVFLSGESDNYGLYLQDTWLPRENISISAGLRYDREEVSAAGFEPFDVRAEFNDFSAFLAECQLAPPGTQNQSAQDILARQFPDLLSAYIANGGSFDAQNGCVQAKPFFLTFPKSSFINDCRRPSSNRFCTVTLDNFSPVLAVKGNRQPEQLQINNNNLAPRLSVNWDPWSNGKTKFFATWGRFFDKTNLNTASAEQGPDFRTRTFTARTNCSQDAEAGTTDACIPGGVDDQASDPDIQFVDRALRTEFNEEWTVGLEREIAPETKIRLTYVSRRFRNQLQDVDFNHYVRDVGPEFLSPVRRQVGLTSSVIGFIPVGGPALCNFDSTVDGLVPNKLAGIPRSVVTVGDALGQPNGISDDCFGASISGRPIADGVPDLFRRNVLFNNTLFLSNLNFSDFEAITVEFIRRMKRNWQLSASWTNSRSVGAADNFQDQSGNDPSLVDDEFGFTGFDIRDVVTVSVTSILPWGDMQLGSVMRYFSGTPYSIREFNNSFDASNQATLRTTFPTRSRNDQRNESFLQFDVTLEKGFLIKKYNATAQLLIQNLLAEDFLTVANFRNDRIIATRNFGRFYEVRFKVNF